MRTRDDSEPTHERNHSNFAEEAVKIHNEYRKKHGVPGLKLNKEVNIV